MLYYNKKIQKLFRKLRSNLTDAEQLLWSHLRGKQINTVQFYRQKIIGNYIVDFYAPAPSLVVEIDGSQHLGSRGIEYDKCRDLFLSKQGLRVLRFNNLQVLTPIDSVLEVIFRETLKT